MIHIDGWISLHRQIQDHWLYKERRIFSRYEAWIDLLMMASHKVNKFMLGGEIIQVNRGEFITSELKLMEKWRWSKSKVRAFLKLLESDGMIVRKTDQKKTTINIVNYSIYQNVQTAKEPQKDHGETTERPQKDTINNVNKGNNENNNISLSDKPPKTKKFIKPTVEEISNYCIERNNGLDAQQIFDHYEANNWYRGKTKISDWKACIRTWEHSNKNTQNKLQLSQRETVNERNNRLLDEFFGKDEAIERVGTTPLIECYDNKL